MTTSESKRRFFLQNESIQVDDILQMFDLLAWPHGWKIEQVKYNQTNLRPF